MSTRPISSRPIIDHKAESRRATVCRFKATIAKRQGAFDLADSYMRQADAIEERIEIEQAEKAANSVNEFRLRVV